VIAPLWLVLWIGRIVSRCDKWTVLPDDSSTRSLAPVESEPLEVAGLERHCRNADYLKFVVALHLYETIVATIY
jgi:hypothetical protein